jgi:hypothetical protein
MSQHSQPGNAVTLNPRKLGMFYARLAYVLLAGPAMAAALARAAISWFGQFAVRPNACLSHGAPEKSVAGARHRGIGL